ncbi:MAG TPA: site-2 protease family protein, partial [Firmicutes bacterium]|nr:site-2 protease family protein [Bacillota bacterium]
DAVTSQYFEPGDRIVSMDGHRVHTANDISFYLSREDDGIMDVVVLRDGEQVSIPDVHFKMVNVQGVDMVTIDFIVVGEEKNLINVPVYALDWTISLTKQVWFSLWDLVFTDRYGVEQMSGPVGVAGAIGESAAMGLDQFAIMVGVITINLGVFNLLPLPALDGGRIAFVLLEMIRRKRLNPNIEGYINMAGLLALMALMVFATFNDILKLI